MDQQLQSIAAAESQRVHHSETVDQSQGSASVSGPPEYAQPRFGVYGYMIPEGDTSPQMIIPNPVLWETPRPQVQSLVDSHNENYPLSHRYPTCCDLNSENVSAVFFEHPAIQQWPFPNHPPAPTYTDIAFVNPTYHVQGGCHGRASLSMSSVASHHPRAFRVPSDSEPGHLGEKLDFSPIDALSDVLEAEDEAMSIPSSTLGVSASTIYPEDSVSTTSRASAPPNAVPQRTLVEVVVEIHDICLAATQRHLETLRVNWDLRNARPVGGADANSLGGRPVRGQDRGHGNRWAPYAAAESRRRVHSESHLDRMAVGSNGEQHQDSGRHHHSAFPPSRNPIPNSTNSLLHNIRHISDIIWRRVQRDREDVLGAEVKGFRDMSFLHECGEMIVLYGVADAERDAEACFHRAVAAGTGICRELKDWEGMRLMGAGS